MIHKKGLTQSYIIVGAPAKPYRYKRNTAFRFVPKALGSGLSSRLYMELREKSSLVYGTHASKQTWKEAGLFTMEARTANKNTPKVVSKMLSVLSKLYRTGPYSRELKRGKNQIRNGFASLMETSDGMASALITFQSLGDPKPYDVLKSYLERVEKVSQSDVKKALKEVISLKNLHVLILTNKDEVDIEKIKKMKWASVQVIPLAEVSF